MSTQVTVAMIDLNKALFCATKSRLGAQSLSRHPAEAITTITTSRPSSWDCLLSRLKVPVTPRSQSPFMHSDGSVLIPLGHTSHARASTRNAVSPFRW
ncbi:MAG: hypothetical protein SFV81_22240 [Pirellulaceae bacterium]|nr:hypothetical protein [Pirellulaceae bacterium]